MNIPNFKKVLVVGLGYRTGLAASNFLAAKGCEVTVSDMKSERELEETIQKLDPAVKLIAGRQDPGILAQGFDLVVLSPGVPATIPLVIEARAKRIPVISEIELSYYYLKGTIIAITGTDGKSTTTALTGHILNELGLSTFVGGNIGVPLISLAEKTSGDSFTVIELSSYQLETIEAFRPDISCITNITPDHLDRYPSMDAYASAKFRITMNQGESDSLVYNMDDEMIAQKLTRVKALRVPFSLTDSSAAAFCRNGSVYVKDRGNSTPVLETSKMKIIGQHNVQNAMAALLMVSAALRKSGRMLDYEKIRDSVYSFAGLEHRMEKVGEYKGRIFINDSKATTVGAVEMALRGLKGNGVLILGGRTKGDDYERLIGSVRGRVKALVLIGESKEKFSGIFREFRQVTADTLDDAVVKSMKLSAEGDVVLLSPACASFDMFKNFEERGLVFKEAYGKLERGVLRWT